LNIIIMFVFTDANELIQFV